MLDRFQIVSMLDMERLELGNIVSAAAYLNAVGGEFRLLVQMMRHGKIPPQRLQEHTKIWTLKSLENVVDFAQNQQIHALERMARRTFDTALEFLARPLADPAGLDDLSSSCSGVAQQVVDELSVRKLYTLSGRHSKYLEEPAPFGNKVEDSFPSASFDIEEAAKCRALGRWTASVMHLMRVMEAGLSSLARHYGIAHEANWNQTLNQIEARSREVGKRSHGAEAEQWAAEAATHLRFVKNAWRNHAMHPSEKYDETRAVAIFDSTRAFMAHLATRLSEVGLWPNEGGV